MNETQLRGLLHDGAESFEGVDPVEVMHQGRTTRRRRRRVGAAAGVSALVLALVLPAVLGGGSSAQPSDVSARLTTGTDKPTPPATTSEPHASPTSQPVAGQKPLNLKPTVLAGVVGGDGYTIALGKTVTVGKNFEQTPTRTHQTVLLYKLPAACIESAVLDLGQVDGGFPDEAISVYPSNLADSARAVAKPRAKPRHFGYGTLLDNKPRAVVRQIDGSYVADVTLTARLWQHGGPFPSNNSAIKPGTPLSLEVLYSDLAPTNFLVHFDRAILRVTTFGTDKCVV